MNNASHCISSFDSLFIVLSKIGCCSSSQTSGLCQCRHCGIPVFGRRKEVLFPGIESPATSGTSLHRDDHRCKLACSTVAGACIYIYTVVNPISILLNHTHRLPWESHCTG